MLFLVTVVLAWGLTWPVNKVILRYLPPLWAVALRTAIAALALVAVAWLRGRLVRPPRGDLPVLLSITLLHMVGFTVLSTLGARARPRRAARWCSPTPRPLWVIPGAWLFLGERLTRRRAAGVAIGLLGLLALFNPLALDWSDRAVVLGHLAIVAAAMLWAGSILHIRGHPWRVHTVRAAAVGDAARDGHPHRSRPGRSRPPGRRVDAGASSSSCSTRACPARRWPTGRWPWRAASCRRSPPRSGSSPPPWSASSPRRVFLGEPLTPTLVVGHRPHPGRRRARDRRGLTGSASASP